MSITIHIEGSGTEVIRDLEQLGFFRDASRIVVHPPATGEARVATPEESAAYVEKVFAQAAPAAEPEPAAPRRRGRPAKAAEPAPAPEEPVEEATLVGEKPATIPEPEPAQMSEEAAWTFEAVRGELITACAQPGNETLTRDLLQHFGVAKLSQLDPGTYPELIAQLRQRTAKGA